MSVICVFPGQGSQKRGMGDGLFERFPEEAAAADTVLGYSVRELCLHNPQGRLADTRFTQPALFAVSALAYLSRLANGGAKPDFLAGHSLGEYTALFAAGAFDFKMGIRLTQRRGELMGKIQGGGMAAVLGLPPEKVQSVLEGEGFGEIELANLNSPKQTVVSGKKAAVDACRPALQAAGGKVILLAVGGAFHSRQMRPAQAQFADWLSEFSFNPLTIPVIANATARPYADKEIRETLARQIADPVLWTDSVRFLLRQPNPQFEEIGPGKVLTSLIRQIRQFH